MPDFVINTGPIISLTAAVGSLDFLVKAVNAGLIPCLKTCFERMHAHGIWISRDLQEQALNMVNQ